MNGNKLNPEKVSALNNILDAHCNLALCCALKEKRIYGLVAYALQPISTGKLERVNNKVRVSKRTGNGFRDDAYFFILIRFLSVPTSRLSCAKKNP